MRRCHYEHEPRLTADLAAAQAFDDAWTQHATTRRLESDIQETLIKWQVAQDGPAKDRLARHVQHLADCRARPNFQWRRTRDAQEDPAAGGWSNHSRPIFVTEEA